MRVRVHVCTLRVRRDPCRAPTGLCATAGRSVCARVHARVLVGRTSFARTCICTTIATYSKSTVDSMRILRTNGKSGFSSLLFDCSPREWLAMFTPAAKQNGYAHASVDTHNLRHEDQEAGEEGGGERGWAGDPCSGTACPVTNLPAAGYRGRREN